MTIAVITDLYSIKNAIFSPAKLPNGLIKLNTTKNATAFLFGISE